MLVQALYLTPGSLSSALGFGSVEELYIPGTHGDLTFGVGGQGGRELGEMSVGSVTNSAGPRKVTGLKNF